MEDRIIILDDIQFQPNVDTLKKKLRIKEGSSSVEKLERIVSDAQAIARPKAA